MKKFAFLWIKLCIGLSLLFSAGSWAESWSLVPDVVQPKVSQQALAIQKEIETIPDPLFMAAKDQKQVNELLAQTILQINSDTKQFSQALARYRERGDEYAWFDAQELYLTLHSLSQSKQELLKLANQKTRQHLTRFGPYGVKQFQSEFELTTLNAQYLAFYQLQSFKSLYEDVQISPVPVIYALIKIAFVIWLFSWWLRQSPLMIEQFRRDHFMSSTPPTRFAKFIWYLSKANRPIAWLICITLCLRILSGIPSLGHLHLLDIFIWWILGGSIAVNLILEFVYRNGRKTNPELTKLRLSTIRYYVWSVILAGVTMQLAKKTIGEGTIYHWIWSLLILWFVIITVIVLQKWKAYIFNIEEPQDEEFPVWARWAVSHKNTFGLASLS
ncbi:MAG: ATP-binding protein, partial [Vibrio sp.]